MLQCYSAEWNECRPPFPTHCYWELNMYAIMICLHRNGCRCQIRTSRTQFQTHCEAPFFALGLHAEGSPSGISFGRCDHSKNLVLIYRNILELHFVWHSEIFGVEQCEWEEQYIGSPVLHRRGVAPSKVPGHVHQVIFNILEIEKTKTKSCPSENVQHRCIAFSTKGEFLWNEFYIWSESSGVRKQDGYRVIVGVSKNIVGR